MGRMAWPYPDACLLLVHDYAEGKEQQTGGQGVVEMTMQEWINVGCAIGAAFFSYLFGRRSMLNKIAGRRWWE